MKRWILWDYPRGTWQYDVLCLLIIGFIFLTPKPWFERAEKLATQTAGSIVRIEYVQTPTTIELSRMFVRFY